MPWWRHFGTDELCSVVIRRDGAVIGFLPLYVYWESRKNERQILPIGVGTTDYLGGVFSPECSAEDIFAGLAFIRDHVNHHRLYLAQMPADSRILAAVDQSSGENLFLSSSEPCSRMPAVIMAELPQKIRRNAMYYRNRAQRQGKLELLFADESNWHQIYGELCRLHTARWQSRGEQGVLVDERVIAWHQDAIPMLLSAGTLRLAALRLNQETIAVLYSLIDREGEDRTQYFYITAYSPDHADLRPGTLLIACAVEHAAQEGVGVIDMLRGDEGYKQIWHMERVPTWCVTGFPGVSQAEADRGESAA